MLFFKNENKLTLCTNRNEKKFKNPKRKQIWRKLTTSLH